MGVVRILSAPKNGTVNGTIGGYGLEPVAMKDFLIYRDNTAQPTVASAPCDFLEARLCDAAGNNLSDRVFKPGMDLPSRPQSTLVHVLRDHSIWQTESDTDNTASTAQVVTFK